MVNFGLDYTDWGQETTGVLPGVCVWVGVCGCVGGEGARSKKGDDEVVENKLQQNDGDDVEWVERSAVKLNAVLHASD